MKIKPGTVLAGLNLKIRPVLIAAEKIWKLNGQELVVTSGIDGIHSAGSLHLFGLAVDFRTYYFPSQMQKELVLKELKESLGSNYDVVLERTHIHVEYDPD